MSTWEDAAPGNRSASAAALTTLARIQRRHRLVRLKFWYRRSMGPPDALVDLKFIYYARTAIVEGFGDARYIYFESDFNGSFDTYIDAFAYVVPQHMKQIWAQAEGFRGPQPATPFKAYIRRHDFPAAHYHARYATATVADVMRALDFREAFDRLRADADDLAPDAFAARWHDLWSRRAPPARRGPSLATFLLRRDTNVALGGSTYGLTVLRPIRSGELAALTTALARLDPSPFADVPRTHFARLVLLDRFPFEGPPQLLFSCVFDGDRDRYLRGLCERIPDAVDGIWGHCEGAPPSSEPAAFVRWMGDGQQTTTTFFAPYARAGVERVQESLALIGAAGDLAAEQQYATPRELQQAFLATWPRR